jgi:multicomponent Na+:H+ antiporter subunit D
MLSEPTAFIDWIVILPVALPLVGAALLLMLGGVRELHWMFAALIVVAVAACDIELVRRTLETGPLSMTMGNWLPPFGISFTADAMSGGFTLAAAAVVLVVLVYLRIDLPRDGARHGIYPLVLLLLAGVSGSFLTGDLFNLYVWFEVMLIASFGLMAVGAGARQLDGAVKYSFVNFLATSLFLLALGLLYGVLGTLNMADIARVSATANPAAMAGVAALLLLAFGMKAAAFPVNAWLPASYHTPSAAVSALLAGLLTKVGVYALLRTLVMLLPASREFIEPALALIAAATLVIAPLGAIAETNLRRALGFLVIGGIGAVMLGIALPVPQGVAGGAAYILHAMLSLAALYLVAGLIEKATGATDTRLMGGLYAASAPISLIFLTLILAVSGVPPFLGFWPKLLLLEAGVDASGVATGQGIDWTALALAGALLVNALLTLIAGTRLWAHIFWRAGPEGARSEAPNEMLRPLTRRETWLGLLPTAILAALVLFLGLYPSTLLEIGRAAALDLLQPDAYIAATRIGGPRP